jgi:two-component system, cell cycle sensor histidine kinase and response regulator CckA
VIEGDSRLPLPPGRYVRIVVRDDGPGIAPEVAERIFSPFFSTRPTGTGLGLATTYSVVKKHGGHIDFTSTPGRGTVFTLHLPAASEGPVLAGSLAPAEQLGRGRVLLMDDEDYVREMGREALEALGYAVETAPGGAEAVACFERALSASQPFDVVILDLTVPAGMGGLATLARLRDLSPEVRVLASSGYSSDAVMADPAAHGFAAGLVKPYTIAELGAAVQAALRRPSAE